MDKLIAVYVKSINAFERFLEDQSGISAIEYALIAAAIAVAIAIIVRAIGKNTSNAFSSINSVV